MPLTALLAVPGERQALLSLFDDHQPDESQPSWRLATGTPYASCHATFYDIEDQRTRGRRGRERIFK